MIPMKKAPELQNIGSVSRNSRRATLAGWSLGAILIASATPALVAATALPAVETVAAFTDRHCSSCHNDVDKEGGIDLTSLQYAPGEAANFLTWVKVHDRVRAGEMPPKEKKRPDVKELNAFVQTLDTSLVDADRKAVASNGRAKQRRLNRAEYENAVRDLFQAPWLEVKGKLPEDGEASRYNKSSDALGVSFVHMKQYMAAAESAVSAVLGVEFARLPTTTKRYYARDTQGLLHFNATEFRANAERTTFPALGFSGQPDVLRKKAPMTVGESDPVTRELEAVGWIASDYEAFPTAWSSFRAPVTGKYRVRFSGYTLWMGPGGTSRGVEYEGIDPLLLKRSNTPRWYSGDTEKLSPGRRDEPIHVYARGGAGGRLGQFDVTPEPDVYQLDSLWLMGGQTLVTDSARFFRSRPVPTRGWTNPLAQRDGVPAVAFRWIEVDGPLYDESSDVGYRLLFGNLAMKKVAAEAPGIPIELVNPAAGGRRGGGGGGGRPPAMVPAVVEVESNNHLGDGERLADHYGIPGVQGVTMRRVALPPGSPRGGFMTQASILKVTANGTTTSPVLRGKWITERIMGYNLPPPPAAVPAIEPDTRGAVTIRQQLDKHRADESCAACHRKIDPPGFALESFDVMGAWRDRYRSESPAKLYDTMGRFGKNGAPLTFHLAQPVDSAGELSDGRAFRDVRDLKSLLLKDEAQLARNLVRQLLVFSTGASERFSDRVTVEKIVQATKSRQYGVRSIVHQLIQSDLFLNK